MRIEQNLVCAGAAAILLATTGCGPAGRSDGLEPVIDEGYDFGIRPDGFKWPLGPAVTWRVTDVTGGSIEPRPASIPAKFDVVITAAANAFRTWSSSCQLAFEYRPSGPVDIEIKFGTTNPQTAVATSDESTHDIILSVGAAFSSTPTVPEGDYDLEAILLHEIGHSIGLWHSSAYNAVMERHAEDSGIARRTLSVDDQVAVSTLYDVWKNETSVNALDVATGVDGSVWIVAEDQRIMKWNGSSFVPTEGGYGVRIAVQPNGRPLVVASNGSIWRRSNNTTSGGSWAQIPGCATDIGVGGSSGTGTVWVLGCGWMDGGHAVYKLGTGGFVSVPQPGGALRISVNRNGMVWIANDLGELYRGSDEYSVWSYEGDGALDVAVGPATAQVWTSAGDIDYAYVLGFDQTVWGLNVQVGNDLIPSQYWRSAHDWWVVNDAKARGTSIAVTKNGIPWTAGAAGGGVRHPLN